MVEKPHLKWSLFTFLGLLQGAKVQKNVYLLAHIVFFLQFCRNFCDIRQHYFTKKTNATPPKQAFLLHDTTDRP